MNKVKIDENVLFAMVDEIIAKDVDGKPFQVDWRSEKQIRCFWLLEAEHIVKQMFFDPQSRSEKGVTLQCAKLNRKAESREIVLVCAVDGWHERP